MMRKRKSALSLLTPQRLSMRVHNRSPSSTVSSSIPPVFNSVVRPSVEMPRDFCPFFSILANELLNVEAFLVRDRGVVKRGFQVLVISFTTLLWGTSRKHLRDSDPVCRAMVFDERHQPVVLAGRPRSPAGRHRRWRFSRFEGVLGRTSEDLRGC